MIGLKLKPNENRKHIGLGLMCLVFAFTSFATNAQQRIEIQPSEGDMTPIVRSALESISEKEVIIVFTKGTYRFLPDYASEKYSTITNHGNGLKKVIFPLEGFDSVEIEGNGSKFIFHGQIAPFQFEDCDKITIKNLTLDWDIPFTFQGEVVAVDSIEGWRDLKPFTEGYSWEFKNNRLTFPIIDGFHFTELGNTLAFDPMTKRVAHGAWDITSRPRWVEQMPNGILRFHELLRQYPKVGSILHSKGEHELNRYAPALHVKSSKKIVFDNITIHHALGMGFLFERTEDITISNCGVFVAKGSDRVVSTIADATHFANCKGDILIQDCRFEHMLDDGTNVHGTYVEVDEVIDSLTVRVALKHFEQMGFEFAGVGDEIWFVQQPSPKRASENKVVSISYINEQYMEIGFKKLIPASLTKGDILENKTWNPTFTMRGCTIKDHRARNIVLKTPKKIIIENNNFSSMMSSIFFRGETFFWFESGAVEDVLIRNNHFEYCAYSGMEHAVLNITPRLGKTFDQTELYDRNIRFENNTINTFDSRIVWADRVDGLVIKNNRINHSQTAKQHYPNAAQFDFSHCNDVLIEKNTFEGAAFKFLEADETTRKTLVIKKNKGFSE